jgi:uncharacterized integral membrane protein (TIGR00698 family)
VELLSRSVLGIDRPLRSLLAAGASICGVSAVASVAASVDAGENDVAYAAGTILLFDAVTILAFPWLGHVLGLSDRVFGVWAGLSMFSTGPVVAAGMAYSPVAGQWATLTKLARNALLGVVIVAYSLAHARASRDGPSGQSRDAGQRAWTVLCSLPVFLLGFLVVSGLASGGVFGGETVRSIEHARSWLFTVAFVGLGTELDAEAVRGVGLRPIVATAAALLTAALLSLALIGVVLGP